MNDEEFRKLKNEVQKMNKRLKELRAAGYKYDTDFNLPLSLSKTKLEENAKIARKINADPKSYIMYYRKNIKTTPQPQPIHKETYEEKKARQKAEKKKYREEKKKKKKELKQQQKEAKKKLDEKLKEFGVEKEKKSKPKTRKEKKKEESIIEKANRKARELERLKLQKKSAAYQTQKMIQRKRLKAKYGDAWTAEDTKKFLEEPLKFTKVEDAEKFLNERTSSADTTYKAIQKTFATIKANDKTGVIKTDEDARLLMLAIEKDNGAKFKNANYGSDVALNEYKSLIKEFKEDLEYNDITDSDMEFIDFMRTKKYTSKFGRAKKR